MARGARLLTRDFVLLSQGQLVSSVGDAVQRVALPFWALAATGSTAWVGTVVAASMLPKILLGPVAGALADRASRRAILVWSDLGAGVTMTLVALAAAQGKLGLWMLLAASVLVGVAGACFDPAIAAALPDLVPPRAVGRANATLSAGYTGASILGSAIGGMAYQAVGATLLFLGNGLSFFYSAASEMFVRFPARRRAGARPRPLDELRAGLSLVWHNAGVRGLLVATGLAHVGNSALLVLLVPHCERHAALGARGFGWFLAGLSGGAFAGFALTSLGGLPGRARVALFIGSSALQAAALGALGWLDSLAPVLALGALAGVAMAVESTLVTTALQLGVGAEVRGKLFGVRASWTTAVGMLASLGAGFGAALEPLGLLISAAAAANLLAAAALALSPAARRMLGAVAPSETP